MSKIKTYLSKMKKAFGKLKMQLYLSYAVTFVVISVLIFSIIFSGVRKMMVSQIGESRLDMLKQTSERSNSIKNNTTTISNLYRYSRMVYDCLTEEAAGEESQQYLDGLRDIYDKVFHDVGPSYNVVIIGNDGFRYSSDGKESYGFEDLKNQLRFRKGYDTQGDIVFINSFREESDQANQRERHVFSASGRITDQSGRELGTILVNVDEGYLYEPYELPGQNSNIYIFDNKGNIVPNKEKSLLGKNYIGVDSFRALYGENQTHMIKKLGKEYLLPNCCDPQTGWTIVGEMPGALIMKPMNRFLLILVAIPLACLITGAGVSYYVAERLTKPVLKLCSSMNQVRQEDFDVVSDIGGYEEVIQLKDSLNDMTGEVHNLVESIQEKGILKRKSEMNFLRAQINPHPLHNTPFSIQCTTELGENDQAVHMMAALIDLLKKTLSVNTELIPLEEEFENTGKCLVLQQIRYGEKIHFECDVEREIETCLVSTLTIQPIAESAIFHGLEAKEGPGLIIVGSSISDDMLFITVSNDEIGMDEEELEQLRKNFDDRKYQSGRSVGVSDVSNRIKTNFGDGYGLTVENEVGIRTTATMRLPTIKHADKG